jgi:hypothetical protein
MQLNKSNYFCQIKIAQILGIKMPWFKPRSRALTKLKTLQKGKILSGTQKKKTV